MQNKSQTVDIPKWSALLVEAVNKPGLIMKAYSNFHSYSLGPNSPQSPALPCGKQAKEEEGTCGDPQTESIEPATAINDACRLVDKSEHIEWSSGINGFTVGSLPVRMKSVRD